MVAREYVISASVHMCSDLRDNVLMGLHMHNPLLHSTEVKNIFSFVWLTECKAKLVQM